MTHPALLALLAAPLSPIAANAQEGAPAMEAPVPLINIAMGDLTTAPMHPKDAALIKALNMLDERLAELPSEFPKDMPQELAPAFAPESIPVWLRLLTMQKRIAVAAVQNPDPYAMPFAFSVAFDETDAAAAEQYEAALKNLLQGMQAPFPPQMIQRDGSALAVNMGASLSPMGQTSAAAMLEGQDLGFEMDMNLGGYMKFMQTMMMGSGAPPEAMIVFDALSRMGLDEAVVEVATACNGNTSDTASVVTNIGGRMRAAGILPETGLSTEHLAPIPADVTWASVQRLDMEAAFSALNTMIGGYMSEQMGSDANPAAMIAGATGIDLQGGLFGALGDTYGMYASEATGGGGLTSTVMFFSLRDAEALIQTKEQIEEIINSQVAAQASGYVSIRTWTRGDDEYSTLMFPGLPVPLEATMAISENWLVIGATPQAAMGAMDQIASSAPSLATKASIAPLVATGSKYGISIVDTEYFARSGYGLTSMMLSGISNGVRSRFDATRDPGPIMPVYSAFKTDIHDLVGSTELHGDDLVTMQSGDGSMVVQMAMAVGFLNEYGLVIMLPALAGAAFPMMAREF